MCVMPGTDWIPILTYCLMSFLAVIWKQVLAKNGINRAVLHLEQELIWPFQHRRGIDLRNAKLSLASTIYFVSCGFSRANPGMWMWCPLQSWKISRLSLAFGHLSKFTALDRRHCDIWLLDSRTFGSIMFDSFVCCFVWFDSQVICCIVCSGGCPVDFVVPEFFFFEMKLLAQKKNFLERQYDPETRFFGQVGSKDQEYIVVGFYQLLHHLWMSSFSDKFGLT